MLSRKPSTAPEVTSAKRLPTSMSTKPITTNAAHFGMPLRRIQPSAGVTTMAMKVASRIGASSDDAILRTVTTKAKAAATIRPRAGALKSESAFMSRFT